ncbi:sn-glycerol-3-phosphate ABC transporter substrate-binding protein, partial [Bacillus sp. AFS075960]
MKKKPAGTVVRSIALGGALMFGVQHAAFAVTEIQFWHAMEAALGERVNELATQFNASQSDYKIVPVFKGTYDQTLAAGIAAYR